MTKLEITKKKKINSATEDEKARKTQKHVKTLVGIHYLGPNIEKHKNTQNTNNTFGHSRAHNEPHMSMNMFRGIRYKKFSHKEYFRC